MKLICEIIYHRFDDINRTYCTHSVDFVDQIGFADSQSAAAEHFECKPMLLQLPRELAVALADERLLRENLWTTVKKIEIAVNFCHFIRFEKIMKKPFTVFVGNVSDADRSSLWWRVWIRSLHNLRFDLFLTEIFNETTSLLLATIARDITVRVAAIMTHVVLVRRDWHETAWILLKCLRERNRLTITFEYHAPNQSLHSPVAVDCTSFVGHFVLDWMHFDCTDYMHCFEAVAPHAQIVKMYTNILSTNRRVSQTLWSEIYWFFFNHDFLF